MYLDYMRGRFEDFLAGSRQLQDAPTAAETQFEAALELGQLDNLVPPAGGAVRSSHRGMHELLLSLAWSEKQNQERAAAARERAVAALAAGNRAERQAAERLQQGPAAVPGSAPHPTPPPHIQTPHSVLP